MKTVISLAVMAAITMAAVGSQPPGDKSVTLTDKDNDGKIDVPKGDKLLVKLSANPTTGFTWVIASKESDNLKLTGEPVYEAANKDKKIVGGGGTLTFTFTAQAAGEVEIEMHYKRTFEKDKEPAKTFKAKITVK